MESWHCFMCLTILLIQLSGAQSQFLSVTNAQKNDVMTITCSYSEVNQVNNLAQDAYINRIQIMKDGETVAFYQISFGGVIENIRGQWENAQHVDVTFEGIGELPLTDVPDNINSARIFARINPIDCSDEAMYRCSIDMVSSVDVPELTVTTNLTVADFPRITNGASGNFLVPDFTTSTNGYPRNMNLTILCQATGPSTNTDLQLHYRFCPNVQNEDPPFTPWPNIQATSGASIAVDECTVYPLTIRVENIQMTSLGFGVFGSSDELCGIRCVVGGQDQVNFTIFYEGDDGNNGATAAPSSGGGSDTPVGAIVGPIVGVVALVALVAVLVYFCWYRKRSKEDEDYREDKPDANDPNMHAAPPVFYTKPEKKPKDDRDNTVIGVHNDAMDASFESKDSGTRGPPRYANTPDFDGPPRYERENSRGHNNRGYDETDRRYARDDDNRRDQNRYEGRNDRDRYDQDERPYRRRDEEAPRARRYSTEDGTDENTVNFNYMGDPNMGTAI